jgi:hypothetical protein
VFGGVFWEAAVSSATEPGARVGPGSDQLRLLVDRELVVPRGQSRFPASAELVFRHALVREAAYEMLTPSDRELGHRLAGAWLQDNGELDAIVLAAHLERGALPEQAVHWYRLAAEEALDANDFALPFRPSNVRWRSATPHFSRSVSSSACARSLLLERCQSGGRTQLPKSHGLLRAGSSAW